MCNFTTTNALFTIPIQAPSYATIQMKENIKTYQIEENSHSGLELELQFMPRFFTDNPGALQPHTHEFYQIIWFQHGKGLHNVDFEKYPITDNTIFFIAPGQLHSFDGPKDYQGVIIHFNATFLADEESSESIFLKYNVFNAYDSLPYYNVSPLEAQHLTTLTNEMKQEYTLTEDFAHKDYMKYLVKLFLIRVQRNGERQISQKLSITNVANRTFVRFRQLLEQNFRTVHSVQEYADMLNITTRTLTKYSNQSSHRPPLQLINERITLEAKRQLLHSMLNIKEIGYNLGFEDPSYFVKFFKRMTGTIPNKFRHQSKD